jgi:hypothetical protein
MRRIGLMGSLAIAAASMIAVGPGYSIERAAERAVMPPAPTRSSRKRVVPMGYRRINRLNRSQHWKRADSYEHARQIAPLPHCLRPVR